MQNIKVLDEVFTSEDEEELVSNSKSTTPASSGNGSSGSSGDTPPPRPGRYHLSLSSRFDMRRFLR